jgi:hypothetical protein
MSDVLWTCDVGFRFKQGEIEHGRRTIAALLRSMAELIECGMLSDAPAGDAQLGSARVEWMVTNTQLGD